MKNKWLLNQFWTKAFILSHILGWTVAWMQTLWIVWEIRRLKNE